MKTLLVGALVAGFSLSTGAIAAPLSTYQIASAGSDHLVSKWKQEVRGKHFRAAETIAERAIAEHPGDYDALMAMGRLKDYMGNYTEAASSYKKCLAAKPDDFDAQVMLAHAYLMDGQYDRSKQLCEKLQGHPGRSAAGAWYRSELETTLGGALGLKAQREGLWAMLRYGLGVRKHFERALDLDGDNPRAHYALGRYILEAPGAVGGNARKGSEMLARASRMDPEDWVIRGYYCRSLIKIDSPNAKEQAERYVADFGSLSVPRDSFHDVFQLGR